MTNATDPNALSMSSYEWTESKDKAVMMLAQGYLIKEVAKEVGVNEKTIDRWKRDIEFQQEMNRLSLMLGIAGRAERIRVAMRVVRQKTTKAGKFTTRKDLLEWLKYVQSETDGQKLDLTSLVEALSSVAGGGPAGVDPKAKDGGQSSDDQVPPAAGETSHTA